MQSSDVQALVLAALKNMNLARDPGLQLEVSPTAPLFASNSPLDSLGLVALLIDVEDALQAAGHDVTLSDDRAMAQTRSPFRDVPSLVAYISALLESPAP